MAQTSSSLHRADEIFRTGPETLIGETETIVFGSIKNYSKQILSQSQPGSDGFPLKWTVKGEISQPQILKGALSPSVPLKFTKSEQSMMLPADEAKLYWEDDYGDLQPDGQAVLFIDANAPAQVFKIISSNSEQDFIALVKDIVRIQGIKQPDEQLQQWRQYLNTTASDEGRRAALRSLINAPVKWEKIASELDQLLTNSKNNNNIRAFGFGIVSFGIIEEKWGENRQQVADFLCRIFSAEQDGRLTMQYIQHLKLVLRYSDEESFRKARQILRRQILDCLKRRQAAGPTDPQLEEQFKQVWAAYPEK